MTETLRVVLLPGLHGTGGLFRDFVSCSLPGFDTAVVEYPTEEPLGYDDLEQLVWSEVNRSTPMILVGESFSGPLALRLAARNPSGVLAAHLGVRTTRRKMKTLETLKTPRTVVRHHHSLAASTGGGATAPQAAGGYGR